MPWIIFVDQFWSKEMIQHGLRNSLEDSSFTIPPPQKAFQNSRLNLALEGVRVLQGPNAFKRKLVLRGGRDARGARMGAHRAGPARPSARASGVRWGSLGVPWCSASGALAGGCPSAFARGRHGRDPGDAFRLSCGRAGARHFLAREE